MEIKLNIKQFEYVNSQLSNEREDLSQHFIGSKQNDKVIIKLEEGVADEIRDWAGEKLQKVGFDKEYNLTEEGRILEVLVDLLYK